MENETQKELEYWKAAAEALKEERDFLEKENRYLIEKPTNETKQVNNHYYYLPFAVDIIILAVIFILYNRLKK